MLHVQEFESFTRRHNKDAENYINELAKKLTDNPRIAIDIADMLSSYQKHKQTLQQQQQVWCFIAAIYKLKFIVKFGGMSADNLTNLKQIVSKPMLRRINYFGTKRCIFARK